MAFPIETVKKFIAARYPIIYLVSWEEERVEKMIKFLSSKLFSNPVEFYVWSCAGGMESDGTRIEATEDPASALDKVIRSKETGLYVFKDIHLFFNDPRLIRKLRDTYRELKGTYKTVFILSPSLVLPPDLEKEFTVVDVGLPDPEEVGKLLESIIRSHRNVDKLTPFLTPEMRDKLIRAVLGLGAVEIELSLTRTLLGRDTLGEEVIDELLEEKAQLIRKSGTIELVRNRVGLNDIGGLENLKEWLRTRALAFTTQGRKFGLDTPKGVLMMGISGCGKSLSAKAVASVWSLPLLRLELNQVYSGVAGTPEEAFRKAIKTVEATAPCVLWIDEIEAGITRSGEKTGDSPTSRIFGYFLTWMQEREAQVFVVATANQIDLLPPEILRKGRFDEIFFVPLPSLKEREEIFRIHLLKRDKSPDKFNLDAIARNTEGLSGSEIEQAVVAGMFEAFSQGKELEDRDLLIASKSIVPLSTTMREEISKLERWAANRAVKASK